MISIRRAFPPWCARCARAAKRFNFFIIPPLLLWAGFSAYQIEKPNPICIYASDFKHLFGNAIKHAKKSIEIITYGLSDEDLLAMLDQKRAAGLEVFALCDARSSPKRPGVTRIKKTGLNHAKITVIDGHMTYLGSANLTTTSLELHHNGVLGIDSKEVASFFHDMLKQDISGKYTWRNLNLFMLPEKSALPSVIQLIDEATHTICIAMFTLSHPALITALERAQNRGVQVKLCLDRYTRQPKTSLSIRHVNGPGLLHHKWALIDNEHMLIGSANWTKAAFSKNREVLAILHHLSKTQQKACYQLWQQLQ